MLDGYQVMIPGPIPMSEDVLKEMARSIVPHYGPEWTEFFVDSLQLLKQVFQTSGKVFAIPGSGSAGLEAAISSSLAESSHLLVLSNGFFGERVGEIASSLLPNTRIVRLPADHPVTASDLERELARHGQIDALAVVHSESSSGLLNPIEELAHHCHSRNLLFIVDAISSLAGVELAMDDMGIDVCISASQKCLEGPPGLALVAVGESAWERIRAIPTRGWYLNLQLWEHYAEMWGDWHPYPITMAVPAFRALRKGVERVLEEGLAKRTKRHRDMAEWVKSELLPIGYRPVFPHDQSSSTVLALEPPSGLAANEVVSRLKTEHRILIAGGMGDFKGRVFRIGNMGIQATNEMMQPVVDALAAVSGG